MHVFQADSGPNSNYIAMYRNNVVYTLATCIYQPSNSFPVLSSILHMQQDCIHRIIGDSESIICSKILANGEILKWHF